MGQETRKRQRDGTIPENLGKAPRLDKENIVVVEDETGLAGVEDYEFTIAHFNAVKGMPNFGNTCSLNALLQCLLALGKFRTEILRPDAKLGLMGIALKQLFVKTNSPRYEGELMDPALLTACVRVWDASFKSEKMHDSQELLLSVLTCLGNEEKEEEEPMKPIHHTQEGISSAATPDFLFDGEICYRSSCICSKVSPEFTPFKILGLPLASEGSVARCMPISVTGLTEGKQVRHYKDKSNQMHSLASVEGCLKRYFEEEKIYWCCSSTRSKEGCKIEESDRKANEFSGHSNSLEADHNNVHQVKAANQEPGYREGSQEDLHICLSTEKHGDLLSTQDRIQNQSKAVNDGAIRISFISKLPHILALHLLRYGVHTGESDVVSSLVKLSGHVSFDEVLDVGQFMDPSYEGKSCIYRLAGVVEHIGERLNEGHYVSYVKEKARAKDQSSRWFHVNDAQVKVVSLKEVQRCEAYMLFYERMED